MKSVYAEEISNYVSPRGRATSGENNDHEKDIMEKYFFKDKNGDRIVPNKVGELPPFDEWYAQVTDVKNKGIYIDKGKALVIYQALRNKDPLLFMGNPGTGKTMMAEKIADVNKGQCTIFIPPLGGGDIEDLIGEMNMPKILVDLEVARVTNDKEMMEKSREPFRPDNFIVGNLLEGMLRGCVTIIDEINRYDVKLQNVLLNIADKKEVFVPNLGIIKACYGEDDCGFQIIATANEGDIGTKPLSSALLRRFISIPFENPDVDMQKQILEEMLGGENAEVIDKIVEAIYSIYDVDEIPFSTLVKATSYLVDAIEEDIIEEVDGEMLSYLVQKENFSKEITERLIDILEED